MLGSFLRNQRSIVTIVISTSRCSSSCPSRCANQIAILLMCDKANSPSFSQNSPSLPQNSVRLSEFSSCETPGQLKGSKITQQMLFSARVSGFWLPVAGRAFLNSLLRFTVLSKQYSARFLSVGSLSSGLCGEEGFLVGVLRRGSSRRHPEGRTKNRLFESTTPLACALPSFSKSLQT